MALLVRGMREDIGYLTLIGGESLGIFLSLGVKAKMGSASNLHNCIKLVVIKSLRNLLI